MLKDLFCPESKETTVATINKTTSSLRHVTIHANARVHRDAGTNLNSKNGKLRIFGATHCSRMGALVKRIASLGDEQIIPKILAKLNKFESKVRAAKSTAVLGGPTFDGQIDESS